MNERVSSVIHHSVFIPVVTGVSAFAAGVGVGFLLGRRKGTTVAQITINNNEEPDFEEYEVELDTGTDKAFQAAKDAVKEAEEPKRPPRVIIDADRLEQADNYIKDILTPKDQYSQEDVEVVKSHEIPDEPPVITKNVFAGDDNDWSYEEEQKTRTTESPYILHRDEFFAEENLDKGYSQVTVTYYAGDNILVDEDDSPIYNHDQIVGDLKFGHGSGDPNVVYIRNDKRNAEYEVLYDSGLYSVEVLGLDIENNERVKDLKHSNSPRKFRPE